MSDVLAALLDEIRALDEAATPGPWAFRPMLCEVIEPRDVDDKLPKLVAQLHKRDDRREAEADAVFLARARTLLPELAEQVQWMRGELEQLALSVVDAGMEPINEWTADELRRIAAGRPVETDR